MGDRLAVSRSSSDDALVAAVAAWVDTNVPQAWRDAAVAGGRTAIREVRSRQDYEAWYPAFAASGLVAATWPLDYGGLDLAPSQARLAETVLEPYNLGRLNPLGLNVTAPALFTYGTEDQRQRFLPPLVRNEEKWCQLLSEPGAGSDLASLATRAVHDGDEWVVTGQKVWTTWAHLSDYAICLARTDPTAPKRRGLTYFLVDLRAPGVDVRPLRHIGGEVEFNEVFLDEVRVPDAQRVGDVGDGWRVAGASLSGERQMVAGSSSGGVDRIGGSGIDRILRRARELGRTGDAVFRQRLMQLYSEERIRSWTNERVRAEVRAGGTPGPAASVGKVHQGSLNQRMQLLAVDLLGLDALAWISPAPVTTVDDWAEALPFEVTGMLRSRANTIEGGTTEVNKNVVGERVLALPREPDPWADAAWEDVPRELTVDGVAPDESAPLDCIRFARMADSGVITDEGIARLRDRIGVAEPHPLPPHYLRPNIDAFRHVAVAYGDDNPLWCDESYGATTRWGGPIAPPPLVGGDTLIGEDEVSHVAAGQRDLMKGDPLRGVHAFYSASAREWWAPLQPDRRVWRRNALVGVLDKPSEFAERAVHEWTAQVFREDDGPILSGQYRLMIRTERSKAREKKKYDAVTIEPYTDDQIAEIEAQYDGESPRGKEPRWWEGVDVGDDIGAMVKGPLTVTDMICWHTGMGMGLYGVRPLRLGAQNRKRVPRFFYRDDLNVPDVQQRVHWDPQLAQRAGNPTTYDYGRMRETWLIHLCTDWMGDDAWLWKLDCEFRMFNYVGDTQWLGGTVTARYLAEGDRPAVDLDLRAINQRGDVTTPGRATILLPSQEHGEVRLPDPPGGAADLQSALDAVAARFSAS